MRCGIILGFLLTAGVQYPIAIAQPPEMSLKEKIQAADLVIVGKVTQTGLSVASSFDVGVIEAAQVLKGDAKTKTANFRFTSSGGGNIAPYGKKGVEGVWVLSKKGGYLESRTVLAFLPPGELKAVKDILANPAPKKENPPQAGGKTQKVYAQTQWNHEAQEKQLVIRNAKELAAAFPPIVSAESVEGVQKNAVAEIAKVLKVADIDFKTQMVVVIHRGKPDVTGETLKITALDVKDGKLTILGEHTVPGAEKPNKAGVYLTLVALVDRFDGPVQWQWKIVTLK